MSRIGQPDGERIAELKPRAIVQDPELGPRAGGILRIVERFNGGQTLTLRFLFSHSVSIFWICALSASKIAASSAVALVL